MYFSDQSQDSKTVWNTQPDTKEKKKESSLMSKIDNVDEFCYKVDRFAFVLFTVAFLLYNIIFLVHTSYVHF